MTKNVEGCSDLFHENRSWDKPTTLENAMRPFHQLRKFILWLGTTLSLASAGCLFFEGSLLSRAKVAEGDFGSVICASQQGTLVDARTLFQAALLDLPAGWRLRDLSEQPWHRWHAPPRGAKVVLWGDGHSAALRRVARLLAARWDCLVLLCEEANS